MTIAIIGVLVGLLLPAVQAARESARRTYCTNNLRQIAVALAKYQSSARKFPVGCIVGPDVSKGLAISWIVELLPHVGESSLKDAFDFSVPSYAAVNKAVGRNVLSQFLCPSTSDDTPLNPLGLWRGTAFTDYGGIYGVEGPGHDIAVEDDGESEESAENNNYQTLRDDSLGVLIYEDAVEPKSITDGLSKTAIVGESLLRRVTTAEWINGHNIFAQERLTPINSTGLANEIGSPHPGGALVAFCDAHVSFVAETIDQLELNAMLTKAGGETP